MKSNILINDDCFNVFKDIEDKSIDLIFCDLPYGVTARHKWDKKLPLNSFVEIKDKVLYKQEFLQYCHKKDILYKKSLDIWNSLRIDGLWDYYNRIIKDNGAIILSATEPFRNSLIESNKKNFRYDLIWEKPTVTGFLNSKRMPLRNHESLLVFYKKSPLYIPQKTYGHKRKVVTIEHKRNNKTSLNYNEYNKSAYDSTERFPKSVLKFAMDTQKESLHPTQKPLKLIEWIIKSYSGPDSIILDNCSGSGTTAIATLKIGDGRKFICIEKDEEIFKTSYNRILKFTKRKED